MKKPKNKNTKLYQLWEIRKLNKDCLKLLKEIITLKAGGKCEVCGTTKMVQAHHVEDSRLFPALRYDPMNGIAACPTNHKLGKHSFHRSFIFSYEFMKDRVLIVVYLREHRDDIIPPLSPTKSSEYPAAKEYLLKQIEKLKAFKKKLMEKPFNNDEKKFIPQFQDSTGDG